MYSPSNPHPSQLKMGSTQKGPLRQFPRPKAQFKPSPSSRYSHQNIEHSAKSQAKNHRICPEFGGVEKKGLVYHQDTGVKKNFQLEMKEFVENREIEMKKACAESKITILMNLLQCIGPYEDSETISLDFLQGFLQVGDSFLYFIFY